MTSKAQILELIADSARQVLPFLDSHAFVESDRLIDLGANSVDRAEIAMLVQESLCLSLPRMDLFAPTNIGQLAELFLSNMNG